MARPPAAACLPESSSLRRLNEFELIDAIRARLTAAGVPEASHGLLIGSGDDAAVGERAGLELTSVDALVEDVHFRIPPFTPSQVGAKALATALSDLAAMGAEAGEAYVQVGLPDRFGDEDALALADGIALVAARHRVAVAGGDLTRAAILFVAVTVVGSAADRDRIVFRAGARAGDAVVITGELGGAAAGRLLLEEPPLAEGLAPAVAEALRARQLAAEPRLTVGAALAAHGASAMIDVSDGVAADAAHIAAASGLALEIAIERVPVQEGVAEVASAAGIAVDELALGGGEDYELIATLAPDRVANATRAVAELGASLNVIGAAREGSGVKLSAGGAPRPGIAGFDQRRARRARSGRV